MQPESVGVEPPGVEARRVAAVTTLKKTMVEDYPTILDQIRRVVRKRTGVVSREEVEEVATETFNEAAKRLLQNPGKFDPERPAFGWIMGVAMKVVGERYRRTAERSRRVVLTEQEWKSVEDRREAAPTSQKLEMVLDRLSPGDREVLELGYKQRLTGESLARVLGVKTVAAARTRVFRALSRAQKLVDAERGEVIP